ncbi:aminotransferase class IV-domain-containing protein [Aspergillus taichungensis]|uniref:Aminotransferase class IV-domain-containing protein n=1 Tax=Aspergillus taichungensis TaxID=482145 RepID=A0A2J5I587_9EURO|nr:aminotransferase class IV-domain-containing protein [Aspergillus taichungensis]
MTSQPSFQIISSLRYDPALPHVAREGANSSSDLFQTPYYLLPYHRERLLHAARCFQWTKAAEFLQQDLGSFVQFLDSFIADKSKPWRLRIVVDRSGTSTVDVHPTAAIDPLSLLIPLPSTSPSTVWHVYVDRESTDPSVFTTHKTTAREVYSAARLRAGIMSPQETAEVLLVNPKGEVMEGSITTVYFRRRQPCDGPAWITPPLSCGGNAGTTRRMKFFENVFTYDYSFPAVSLAYFLRYPNPYSRHVLTTDVIDRFVDPSTQRLHTIRLHLKKSKVPSGILKLLPKGIGGADKSGQSYILETTVVDAKEGWMRTESRNMEWTGILSVVERQVYQRLPVEGALDRLEGLALDSKKSEQTTVQTTVTFRSRLGQGKLLPSLRKTDRVDHAVDEEDAPPKGFFSSLSTAGLQRTIELIGVSRTRDAILKSKQGMNVVLERLRNGGIVEVLEGMRQDREAVDGPWKRVWLRGNNNDLGSGDDDRH